MNKGQKFYRTRRQKIIEFLGGRCVQCQSTEKLEFDHIDPSQKSLHVGEFLTHSWTKIEPELKKCQLLCRLCHKSKTILGNMAPRPGLRKSREGSKSQFTGVDRMGKGWRSRIRVNGKRICLGTYKSEKEAASAYNRAAVQHFGEKAILNKV